MRKHIKLEDKALSKWKLRKQLLLFYVKDDLAGSKCVHISWATVINMEIKFTFAENFCNAFFCTLLFRGHEMISLSL